jgi:hypothetical protein
MTTRPAPLLPHLDPDTPLVFGLRNGGRGAVTEVSPAAAALLARLPERLVREAVGGARSPAGYDEPATDYAVSVGLNGPYPHIALTLRPLGDGAYRAELPGERPVFDLSIGPGADPARIARRLRALADAITAEPGS